MIFQAHKIIEDYIQWYNYKRMHSTLDHKTPADKELEIRKNHYKNRGFKNTSKITPKSKICRPEIALQNLDIKGSDFTLLSFLFLLVLCIASLNSVKEI